MPVDEAEMVAALVVDVVVRGGEIRGSGAAWTRLVVLLKGVSQELLVLRRERGGGGAGCWVCGVERPSVYQTGGCEAAYASSRSLQGVEKVGLKNTTKTLDGSGQTKGFNCGKKKKRRMG
jgi:hypothetical protein